MKLLLGCRGLFLLLFVSMLAQGCGNAGDLDFELAEDTAAGEVTQVISREIQETGDDASSVDEGVSNIPKSIYVHVCGAVNSPGVYMLKEGDRVFRALELAGGLAEDAFGDKVNQASFLEDGMMIRIPTISEIESDTVELPGIITGEVPEGVEYSPSSHGNSGNEGKVNINTAGREELCTLPGVGPSRADRIIAYRESEPFISIEDIKNVSGIGQSIFLQISNLISVN